MSWPIGLGLNIRKTLYQEQCQELVYESALSFVRRKKAEKVEKVENVKKVKKVVHIFRQSKINRTIKDKDTARYDGFKGML